MTINKESLSRKTTPELLSLKENLVDLIPVNELKQVSDLIDEIIAERKAAAVMKPFTRSDWCGLAGAEKFPDGSEPWVGYYGLLTVVVDRNGLQAWLEDMENHVFHIDAAPEFKDITIGTGNLLLDQAKQKTDDELIDIFKKL